MIGWEKGSGDREWKGRTRNQANVSGSRMSMTLLRLSIDSPLRASEGKRVRYTGTDVDCDRFETHLVKSYAKTVQRRAHYTCPRLAIRFGRDVDGR